MNVATEVPQLALRPREAALALSISPRLLWELTKTGRIPCTRLGTGKRQTVLYSLAALRNWLDQPGDGQGGRERVEPITAAD